MLATLHRYTTDGDIHCRMGVKMSLFQCPSCGRVLKISYTSRMSKAHIVITTTYKQSQAAIMVQRHVDPQQ